MENTELTNLTPGEELNGNENAEVTPVNEGGLMSEAKAETTEVEAQLTSDDKELIAKLIEPNQLPEPTTAAAPKAEVVEEVAPVTGVAEEIEVVTEVEAPVTEALPIVEAREANITEHAPEHLLDEETVEEIEAMSEHDFAGLNK